MNLTSELLNQCGHLEIVEFLIAKGANIHQANNENQTPFWIAAWVWISCFFFRSFLYFFSYVCDINFAFFFSLSRKFETFNNNNFCGDRRKESKLPRSCWKGALTLIILFVVPLLFAWLVEYALFWFMFVKTIFDSCPHICLSFFFFKK